MLLELRSLNLNKLPWKRASRSASAEGASFLLKGKEESSSLASSVRVSGSLQKMENGSFSSASEKLQCNDWVKS